MKFKLWLEAKIGRSKHIPYEYDILIISLPYNVFVNSVKKPIIIERDIKIKEKGQIDFYMMGRLVKLELTDENNEVIDNVYFRLDSEFYSGDEKLHPSSAILAFENNEQVSVHIKINLNPADRGEGEDIKLCQDAYDLGYFGYDAGATINLKNWYEKENMIACWGSGRYDLINLYSYGYSRNFDIKNSKMQYEKGSVFIDYFSTNIMDILTKENKIFNEFYNKFKVGIRKILQILNTKKENKEQEFKEIFDNATTILNSVSSAAGSLILNVQKLDAFNFYLNFYFHLREHNEIKLKVEILGHNVHEFRNMTGEDEFIHWINGKFGIKFNRTKDGFEAKITSISQFHRIIANITEIETYKQGNFFKAFFDADLPVPLANLGNKIYLFYKFTY